MKCPHCNESVSLFSRDMNNFGKNKICPHCQKPIRLCVNLKVAALLVVPSVILTLLLKPVFVAHGISGSSATGLATGLLVILAARLETA
jgi:hypothetical protein